MYVHSRKGSVPHFEASSPRPFFCSVKHYKKSRSSTDRQVTLTWGRMISCGEPRKRNFCHGQPPGPCPAMRELERQAHESTIDMSEVVKWQGSAVEVQARLVPRYLWNTASVDVFLDNQRILRTGGQMKFTGSYATTFTHAGSTHKAELSWGLCGLSFSFPYRLQIDGAPVAHSRVRIRNWPVALIVVAVLVAVLLVIIHFFHTIPA